MASWTDSLPEFKPYVEQLPVEAMVKVGMEKQKRYEQGVQKIQSSIDNIVGLDIMRGVDKTYLQSKLNELGNDLKIVAAGDFSNFQLVNSVTGMTNQISKDKYIQAAVQSTAWHKKQQGMMEEERKKGTLTPENEDNYKKQLSKYLDNNELAGEGGTPITFGGSYVPYFDVWKFTKETFDALKEDGYKYDQIFVTDENGKPRVDENNKPILSPYMTRQIEEGILPTKVKETLNQVFADPRVSRQLQISGEYVYKNYDSDTLFSKLESQRETLLANNDQAILDLNIKKNNGEDVDDQLDALKQRGKSIVDNYQSYADMIYDNPDAIRGMLYKDDVTDRYTTMFTSKKVEKTYESNPAWEAEWKQRVHNDEMLKDALKGDGKTGGSGGGKISLNVASRLTQGDQPSAIDLIGKVEHDYNSALSTFKNASDKFIWQSAFSGDPEYEQQLNTLINAGNDPETAKSIIIDLTAKKAQMSPEQFRATYGEKAVLEYNKLTADQKDAKKLTTQMFTNYKNAKRDLDGMKSLADSYLKSDEVLKLGIGDGQTLTYKGKQLKLSSQDIIDLAVYHQGNKTILGFDDPILENRSKSAYARLQAKGLGDIADVVNRDLSTGFGSAKDVLKYPITSIGRALREIPSDIYDAAAGGIAFGDRRDVALKVYGIVDKLNDKDYISALEKRTAAIRSNYGILPNLQGPLLTGDGETDKNTIFTLRTLAGNFSEVGNLSYDFKKFSENLPELDKLDQKAISVHSIIDENGDPRVEVVIYGKDGKREGGMTLSNEEALTNLGIDVDSLYESKSITILKNKITHNGNKSCDGEINKPITYEKGDYIYDNDDFPGLSKSKDYQVKVNFQFYDGKYYPFIYIKEGSNPAYVSEGLDGAESLQDAYLSLKKYMNPSFIKLLPIPKQ